MTRMKKKYVEEVAPALMEKFQYKSVMQIPKIDKIVVSVGCGDCKDNAKALDNVIKEISAITGQHAVATVARKSVANFKLREGMQVGVKVTLRQDRMWEFLDRLLNVALPRVRDFRGISADAFDGRGNYSMGLKEQIIFPEIEYDKIEKLRGMNIAITTTAQMKKHASCSDSWALRSRTKEELTMAKKSMILKQQAPAKFSTRKYNRCKICGRPHAYLRDYGICRICFRELAYKGQIPGVRKASW